jgi:hypothetical protein
MFPSLRMSNPQVPKMPIGAIVDIEPNTAMCLRPTLEIIDDQDRLGAAPTNSFAIVPLTWMRIAVHSPGIRST